MATMIRMWKRIGMSRGAHERNPGVHGWRLANRVKRYGYALKQVVSPMPTDATEIPQFFQTLEAMFRSFEIPADLRAKLLLPFFSLKAKSLICRLNVKELEDYEGVRYFLLSELNSLPENINRGLIMRPSVPMKDLFCCATQK